MDNGGYLFAAFGAVWALVFGYVIALVGRQRRLRRDLDMLRDAPGEEESGR